MKKSQPQSGSAHLVIIIILVVALLGTLGFVFWQNVISKTKTNPTTADSQSQKTSPVAVLTKYCTTGEKLCFDYPEGWSVSKLNPDSQQAGYTGDDLSVDANDKSLKLTLHSGIDGLGGTCSENEKTPTYLLDSTAVPNMKGFKSEFSLDALRVARVVYPDFESGKYVASLYVTGDQEYTVAKTISSCGIMLSQFMTGRNAIVSTDAAGLNGSFEFGYTGVLTTDRATFSTVQAAKNAYGTPGYVQAAAILSSLRYNN